MTPKHFHSLPIIGFRKTTTDCAVITIGVTPELAETFTYQAGQYVAVHAMIDGHSVRRSYSICSAPSSGLLSIGIKRIANGLFSTYANDVLKVGDTLDVMAPMGSFVLKAADTERKHILYIAAGSGITPILSHLEEHLSQKPNIRVSLIYGNRTSDSTLFKDEIDALKDRYMSRISIYPIFSKEKVGIPLFHGRIDDERCSKIFKLLLPVDSVDSAYICGPGEMIFAAKDALLAQGMNTDQIHYELFTTEGMPAFKTDTKPVEKQNYDPAQYSQVTIKLDGEILDFALAYGGQNILDAALANGADLPYACKGGVCSTCKAKVADGDVIMTLNYSLEPDEIERGFTLTCQAHPRTEKVFIDFDQK